MVQEYEAFGVEYEAFIVRRRTLCLAVNAAQDRGYTFDVAAAATAAPVAGSAVPSAKRQKSRTSEAPVTRDPGAFAAEAGAAKASTASVSLPTADPITRERILELVTKLIASANIAPGTSSISVTSVRAELEETLGARAGRDYDRVPPTTPLTSPP